MFKKHYRMDHHNWREVSEEIVRRDLEDFYGNVDEAIEEMTDNPSEVKIWTTWANYMWVEEE